MQKVIWKSLIVTVVMIAVTLLLRDVIRTDSQIADVGGIGAFLTAFTTLYGILSAFIVFEVWGQYNKTALLIDKEAQGLERLYQLTLYFRDPALLENMRSVILNYINIVVEGKFSKLAQGQRGTESSKVFRQISEIIETVKFDDDHDQAVFSHVVNHYGKLFQIRTERISQSLARLPIILKLFFYTSSFFVIAAFAVMPFVNLGYSLFCSAAITFVISMVLQLVEDLDNPFQGYWKITPEAFSRTAKHIQEDY